MGKRLGRCPNCKEDSVKVKIYWCKRDGKLKRVEYCINKGRCRYVQLLPFPKQVKEALCVS